MKKNLFLWVSLILWVSACSEQLEVNPINNDNLSNISLSEQDNEELIAQKNMYLSEFSEILSKAVAQNKNVRDFLKTKALERIDNDFNVFYPVVKDELIDGKTFESILNQYSTDSINLLAITKVIPLLNIHIPELFDNKVAELDIEDDEIPVLNGLDLYYNGELIDTLAADELPAFNLLVVNESSSIRKRSSISKSKNGLFLNSEYEYVDDVFNPNCRIPITKTSGHEKNSISHHLSGFVLPDYLDPALRTSFAISQNKKTATRAVMYYNMNSIDDTNLELRPDVRDCIFRFQLNPDGFDKYEKTANDKSIFDNSCSNKKTSLTREEVLKKLINGEQFKFRFVIEYNNSTQSTIKPKTIEFYVNVEDLYDFYINESYKHSTVFGRHSKYSYKLDSEQTRSKWYYPLEHRKDTRLERWDLKQDAIAKYIAVYLVHKDAGSTISYTQKYSQTKVRSGKIGTEIKWDTIIKLGIDGEFNASNTTSHDASITYSYSPKDIFLGEVSIDFFQDYPIEKLDFLSAKLNNYGSGEISLSLVPITNTFYSKMLGKTLQ